MDLPSISTRLLSRDTGLRASALKDATALLSEQPACAMSLWSLACTTFQSGPAWEEVENKSRIVRAGPRVDALLLLALVYAYLPASVLEDVVLWNMLLYGIQVQDSNTHHRKAAVMVLRRAVQDRLGDGIKGSSWPLFFTLLDAVEDMPTHLILEVWPRVTDLLYPPSSPPATGHVSSMAGWGVEEGAPREGQAGQGGQQDLMPQEGRPVPRRWVAALMNRAFTSEQSQSKRNVLLFSLGGQDMMDVNKGSAAAPPGATEAEESMANMEAAEGQAAVAEAELFSDPIYGDYVATYVKKPWATVGPDSVWDATPALLACMPPWYVAGKDQLLACLMDPSLFAGSVATFGRALGRFLVSYGKLLQQGDARRIGERQHPLYIAYVRALMASLPMFAHVKGGLKAMLRVLMYMPPSPTTPILDDLSLSCLRSALLVQSHINSRAMSEGMMRAGARVVMRLGRIDGGEASLANVGLFLTTLPASVCLDLSVGCAYPSSLPCRTPQHSFQQQLHEWAENTGSGVLQGLTKGVEEYLFPATADTAARGIPWTAVALARMLCFAVPTVGQAGMQQILAPLQDKLSTLYSHAYMDAGVRSRALLLLRALLCTAFPSGGNADVHLCRSALGSSVPVGWSELPDPLHVEWAAATRLGYAIYPASLSGPDLWDSLSALTDSPGTSPYDDVEEALAGMLAIRGDRRDTGVHGVHGVQGVVQSVRNLLKVEGVASEVSSFIESQLSSGLSLATASAGTSLSAWSPDMAHGQSKGAGRDAGTVLSSTCYMALLRDCIRAVPQCAAATVATRLLGRAADVVIASTRSGQAATQASAVGTAHALHVLAVETAVLLPCLSSHAFLLGEAQGAASGPNFLLSLLTALLGVCMWKPAGATEPALPLKMSNSPGGEDALADYAHVSWLSLRSLSDRARWVCVESLLRHGSTQGWGVERGKEGGPTSIARLPLEQAEALAAAVCDAIDSAGDSSTSILFSLAAWVLPYCMSHVEDPQAVNTMLCQWTGRQVQAVEGTRMETVLKVLEQQAWIIRPTRADMLSYTGAITHPCLFLRPSLHTPASPLMAHIVKAWNVMSDDAHIPMCGQIFAARLLSSYSVLVSIGGNTSHPLCPSAQSVLSHHIPFLLTLLLHKEFAPPWEDPQLVDSHTRAQLLAWLQHRMASPSASLHYWAEGYPDVIAMLQAAGGVEEGRETGPARAAQGRTIHGGDMLASRGAGAVTRVQALTWLDDVCQAAVGGNPCALTTVHSLALQLTRLNTTGEWRKESPAGSVTHVAKLRAWQALALIAGYWGRIPSSCFPSSSLLSLPGLTYDPPTAMWVTQGEGEGEGEGVGGRAWKQAHVQAQAILDSMMQAGKAGSNKPAKKQGNQSMKLAPSSTTVSSTLPWASSSMGKGKGMGMGGPDGEAQQASGQEVLHPVVVALIVLKAAFHLCLLEPQTPSLRHYMESCAVALSRHFPAPVSQSILLPMLQLYNPKSQAAFSVMLVTADVVRHVANVAAQHAGTSAGIQCGILGRSLLSSLFPWLTCPVGLVRLLAQLALDDAVPTLFGEGSGVSQQERVGLDMWVMPTLRLVRGCAEVHTLVQKQRRHLARIIPEHTVTLRALLTSPVTEHGELVPADVFSSIRTTFQTITVAMHVRDPMIQTEADCVPPSVSSALTAGLLSPLCLVDARFREAFLGQQGVEDGPGGKEGFNFQRKVLSASEASNGPSQSSIVGPGTDGPAHVGYGQQDVAGQARALVQQVYAERAENAEDGEGQGGSEIAPQAPVVPLRNRDHPLLSHRSLGGRPCQPVIVVASLVDKAPNLGGLARTCEIFSAEALVVRDTRVKEDPAFKDTSLTAASWIPMHSVAPDTAALKGYLMGKQREGYTVVGLEQAARSVMMGSPAAVFPDKVVLVLGAEKEGLPADLLSMVDMVVEIPQSGYLRSLNVHVSAALLVWEYTRQRLARLGAPTSATA